RLARRRSCTGERRIREGTCDPSVQIGRIAQVRVPGKLSIERPDDPITLTPQPNDDHGDRDHQQVYEEIRTAPSSVRLPIDRTEIPIPVTATRMTYLAWAFWGAN